MEDSKIIELFYARSEQAIAELSKKYGRLCSQIAFNIVKNECDAEECVSDAYLKVWNSIPPNDPDSLIAYTCQIVRNQALNKLEANKTLKRDGEADTDFDEVLACIDDSYDIEHIVDAKLFRQAINDFLRSIDRESRVIFVKRYFYCNSIEDIAKELSKSAPAIGMRLTRIKKRLKKYLIQKGIML